MIAYFLTAGYASRFRPQSSILPKPMIPFLGAPILSYAYEFANSFNLDTCIFNLHHLADQQRLGALDIVKDKNLIFLHEQEKILGSGGALIHAKKHFTSDFMLINGDEAYFPKDDTYKDFVNFHKQKDAFATLLVSDHPEAGKSFGAIWLYDEQVVGFGKESPKAGATAKHFLGASILNPEITAGEKLRDCNVLYDLLLKHLNNQKVLTYQIDLDWFELGNANDLLLAQNYMAIHWEKFKNNELLKKVFLRHHQNSLIEAKNGNLLISRNASRPRNYSGCVCIGDNVDASQYESLENSVLFSNSPDTSVKNQIIL